MVRIAQEGDYRARHRRGGLRPYKPTLTFGTPCGTTVAFAAYHGGQDQLGVLYLRGGVVFSAVFGTVLGVFGVAAHLPARIRRGKLLGLTAANL